MSIFYVSPCLAECVVSRSKRLLWSGRVLISRKNNGFRRVFDKDMVSTIEYCCTCSHRLRPPDVRWWWWWWWRRKSSVPARNRNHLPAVNTLIELSRLTCLFSITTQTNSQSPSVISHHFLLEAANVRVGLPARMKIVVPLLSYQRSLRENTR